MNLFKMQAGTLPCGSLRNFTEQFFLQQQQQQQQQQQPSGRLTLSRSYSVACDLVGQQSRFHFWPPFSLIAGKYAVYFSNRSLIMIFSSVSNEITLMVHNYLLIGIEISWQQ